MRSETSARRRPTLTTPSPVGILRATLPDRAVREHAVGSRRLKVGSDPSCQLVLPVAGVAPCHLRVRAAGTGLEAEFVNCGALGSVLVNGIPLEKAILREGDAVSVCGVVIQYLPPGTRAGPIRRAEAQDAVTRPISTGPAPPTEVDMRVPVMPVPAAAGGASSPALASAAGVSKDLAVSVDMRGSVPLGATTEVAPQRRRPLAHASWERAWTYTLALLPLAAFGICAFPQGAFPLDPAEGNRLLFLLVACALLVGLSNSLGALVNPQAVRDSERAAGSWFVPYLLAKAVPAVAITALQDLILAALVMLFVPGLGATLGNTWALMVAASVAAVGWGLAFSALARRADRALALLVPGAVLSLMGAHVLVPLGVASSSAPEVGTLAALAAVSLSGLGVAGIALLVQSRHPDA